MRIYKGIIYILTVLIIGCNSSSRREFSHDSVDSVSVGRSIYLEDLKDSNFTPADFGDIIELSNDYPERLDRIPDSLGYKLTSNKTDNVTYYCRFIDTDGEYPWGEFRMENDSMIWIFLISFMKVGRPIDVLGFKFASRILSGDARICNKYYSNLMYSNDGTILINILDTTKVVDHPGLAKILKKDVWQVDVSGRFSAALQNSRNN
jgi:hypothetical protein